MEETCKPAPLLGLQVFISLKSIKGTLIDTILRIKLEMDLKGE